MIFAFGQNLSRAAVTLSSNLAPTAITQSESCIAMFASYVPCIPNIPSESSLVAGKAPSPIKVCVIGKPRIFTNSLSSLCALPITVPPPE